MGWGHRTTLKESIYWEGGTPHNMGGWVVGGGPSQEMIPLRGSILQAETYQILSLAENPRWSRVWQKSNMNDVINRLALISRGVFAEYVFEI